MKGKKGQEEIVGFVALVILVAVAFLIILSISLNSRDSRIRESQDIQQYLESSWKYTSSCALGYVPNYVTYQQLLIECQSDSGKRCLDGETACQAAERTTEELLNSSWYVGEDRPIKGYEFKAVYSSNSTDHEPRILYETSQGDCSKANSMRASSPSFAVLPGSITTRLQLCY